MTTPAFLLVSVEGLVTPLAPEPGESTLNMLQRGVGGLVDVVASPRPALAGLDVWVHDEGRVLGLELSPLASWLAGRGLVGPAVLATVGEEGETLPLTGWLLDGLGEAGLIIEPV